MLRTKPRLTYCGLTIILSNPSRFDTNRLLSANGGKMFDDFCLRPEFNSMQCDIRLMEDTSPFLDGTKCLLLFGESAMYRYLPETITSSLGAERGSLYYHKGIPTIASFFPQDAVDSRAYEQSLNPLSKDYAPEDSSNDDEDDEGDVKAFGKTRRSNYAFWIRADVRKCKAILQGFKPVIINPIYRVYPAI